jgi:LMBR1 domain-containing protein 1
MGNSSSLTTANTDPLLIVGITLLVCLVMVVNVYTLVYWQHPDDKNESYFAKFVIVFGLQLSSMAVLMLPIDVANNQGSPSCDSGAAKSTIYCGGIDMLTCWEAIFCMVATVFVLFIPFSTFYYEADDGLLLNPNGKKKSRLFSAAAYESLVLFGFLCMLLSLYYTEASTSVPLQQHSTPFSNAVATRYTIAPGSTVYTYVGSTLTTSEMAALDNFKKSSKTVSYQVGFAVYVIALSGWIGWWLFAVFCGVGLATLPFDMFMAFIFRPRILAPDELATKEAEIQERTAELLEITVMLKRERMAFSAGNATRADKRQRIITDRLEINRLTQMVFLLERDIAEIKSCKTVNEGYNPLVPFFKLFAGLVFTTLSIMWILQMFFSMIIVPSPGQLLNVYLIQFDTWFPMFGNLTYAIFSVYLLLATVAGCFKIGLRFICCKIHPMEPGGTYVNSFLFNLGIVLLCTIPIVHFCVQAFEGYARNTDSFLLFNVQIKYLTFYSQFWTNNVFTWIIIVTFSISFVYQIYRPRETAPSADQFKTELARRGADYSAVAGSDSK